MFWIGGVLALGFLAGAVFLARYVAAGGGPRTVFWLVLLASGALIGSLLAQIASIYYRLPAGWIVVLVLAAAVLVTLFVRVGRDLKWNTTRMFGVIGMLGCVLAIMTMALVFAPIGGLLTPRFEIRAQQIAEAAGFDALFAPEEVLNTEYMPISELATPGGVMIEYEGFLLQERKADGPLGEDALRKLMAEGADPLGENGPIVTGDAEYQVFEVRGNPALGVEYADETTDEKAALGIETVRVLVFETGGVEVRIYSHGWMQYEGESGGVESYAPVDALSYDEMVAIAESLDPLR